MSFDESLSTLDIKVSELYDCVAKNVPNILRRREEWDTLKKKCNYYLLKNK